MQSWVIDVDGLIVVVDTGVGNDRERPHMPPLDHLDTEFLDNLATAGCESLALFSVTGLGVCRTVTDVWLRQVFVVGDRGL